ncbi:MAG: hypothetical protein CHACPFDD_02374 [Phycisphaerae bacterium]|nr:hypothetical protein [Phycisphaerae bacterium]
MRDAPRPCDTRHAHQPLSRHRLATQEVSAFIRVHPRFHQTHPRFHQPSPAHRNADARCAAPMRYPTCPSADFASPPRHPRSIRVYPRSSAVPSNPPAVPPAQPRASERRCAMRRADAIPDVPISRFRVTASPPKKYPRLSAFIRGSIKPTRGSTSPAPRIGTPMRDAPRRCDTRRAHQAISRHRLATQEVSAFIRVHPRFQQPNPANQRRKERAARIVPRRPLSLETCKQRPTAVRALRRTRRPPPAARPQHLRR